jgi:hypothetical protein
VKITIPNFRKFNPRSDLKSMPWLRLQNNFYDLEDFYNSDSNTIWLFIFLLCQCAQKVSETINLSSLITKSCSLDSGTTKDLSCGSEITKSYSTDSNITKSISLISTLELEED